MKRRLLNLLTALCLLLCAAVWGLWVQSEVRPVLWAWPLDRDWQFESAAGELRIIHQGKQRGRICSVSTLRKFGARSVARLLRL